MARIEGADQPIIGNNRYKIVSEQGFAPDTVFEWRTKSIRYPNEPFTPIGQSCVIQFKEEHAGISFMIEARYKIGKNQWEIFSKSVKVVSNSLSQDNSPKTETPDTGNKSAVVNIPNSGKQKEDTPGKQGITLKLHMYFDGTFGNRHNIYNMNEAVRNHIKDASGNGLAKPDIHDDKYRIQKQDKEGHITEEIDYAAYDNDVKDYKKRVNENKGTIEQTMDSRNVVEKGADIGSTYQKDGLIGAAQETYNAHAGFDPTNDIISYTQAYTNVAIMWDLEINKVENTENDTEKVIKVYVEGVGTNTGKGDDLYAMGTGQNTYHAGITAKVERAFEEIIKRAKQFEIENDLITSVEVCAIGFSRGSATTRNFVAERDKLLFTLRKINDTITGDKIKYTFVGIYDTVCSVTDVGSVIDPLAHFATAKYSTEDEYNDWITTMQRNNIKDYKLAMGDHVKNVVHLTAADEYRKFFPLTTIQSSIDAGCGLELVLPGSHCDLGGGDADLLPESYEEEVYNGDKGVVSDFLKRQAWYPQVMEEPLIQRNHAKDQYTSYDASAIGLGQGITTIPGYNVIGTKYKFNRTVTVGYNRIPLAMMLHFACDKGEIKYEEGKQKNKTKVHHALEKLRNEFVAHAQRVQGSKRDASLVALFNSNYNDLRKTYLHLSAFMGKGIPINEKIKDLGRFADDGTPCRAILNDTDKGVQWLVYGAVKVKRAVEKAVEEGIEKTKEAVKQILDGSETY